MKSPIVLALLLAAAAAPAQEPQRKQQPRPAERPAARNAAAAAPSYKDLKFPALRPIQIPTVETYTLPNGMKVFLLEDHELPLVSGTARIRTGNLFDPPEKVGLAGIAGRVMRTGGTRDKTGDQLDEQLENIAASVESSIGETSGTVSFSALAENTDEVMAIFRDVLTAPAFRQDKIELEKSQTRSGISRRNDDAASVASREFTNIAYGRDTPYGWQLEYATVNRIARDDLVSFYRSYYFPANILLAVWGDFDTAQMKARLDKLFGGWNYQQPPVPPFPQVKKAAAPGAYVADKSDVTQTFLTVGHLGGEFRDPDYPALEVMADILGGGFRSRLVQRVRTQLGYAYSIGANWGANYSHPGLFEISGSVRTPVTAETIKAVREEIERIRTQEVADAELATARESALNSMVFAFDTKAKTLARMVNYEYYGYPRDFIQRYQKALAAVTKADVLRVAREHLDPARLTIVAVGPAGEVRQSLATMGVPVASIDLTIPEDKPAAAKADAASLERGVELLRRVQQAVGGAEKLAAVKDIVERARFSVDPSAGGMSVEQVNRWLAPQHFRQESRFPAGMVAAYSDGQTGWIVTPQGAGPLAGPQLQQVRGDLFRLWFRLLLSDRMPDRKVNWVEDNTLEITGPEGQSARLVVDAKTGLPDRVVYRTIHVTGPPSTVEDRYARFQEVAGIQIPFQTTIFQGGRKFADVTVQDYRINTGLTVEELSKRP